MRYKFFLTACKYTSDPETGSAIFSLQLAIWISSVTAQDHFWTSLLIACKSCYTCVTVWAIPHQDQDFPRTYSIRQCFLFNPSRLHAVAGTLCSFFVVVCPLVEPVSIYMGDPVSGSDTLSFSLTIPINFVASQDHFTLFSICYSRENKLSCEWSYNRIWYTFSELITSYNPD